MKKLLFWKRPFPIGKYFLIKPSRRLPITSFDYTDPTGVKECFEMGKEDVEKLKPEILKFCRINE